MDGLVEQVTACIARLADQGGHGRGAGGRRHSPWGGHQRVADRDPTRGTTVLITMLLLAFLIHITASVLIRSAMPGLATSILPGVPGAVMLLTYIWTR
jgi:hypothetical protein